MDDILAKKNRHLFLEEKDNTHNSFISNINYAVENIDTIKTFNENVNSGTMQHLLETYIEQVGTEGNAWVVKLTELGESILATTSGFNYAAVLTANQNIETGATITLPEAMKYRVGTHMFLVSWNGTVCYNGEQYEEVGSFNEKSTVIKIKQDIKTGDKLEFRTVALADTASVNLALGDAITSYAFSVNNSNTKRILEERFSDIANVKDFGAKGDGITDDTAAFQAAAMTGRQVYVPKGNYNILSVINANKGTYFGESGSSFVSYKLPVSGIVPNQHAKRRLFAKFKILTDDFSQYVASEITPQGFTIYDNKVFITFSPSANAAETKLWIGVYDILSESRLTFFSTGQTSTGRPWSEGIRIYASALDNKTYLIHKTFNSETDTSPGLAVYDITMLPTEGTTISPVTRHADLNLDSSWNFGDGYYLLSQNTQSVGNYRDGVVFAKYNENFERIGFVVFAPEDGNRENGNFTDIHVKAQSIAITNGKIYRGCGAWFGSYDQTSYSSHQGLQEFTSNGDKIGSTLYPSNLSATKFQNSFGFSVRRQENEGLCIYEGRLYSLVCINSVHDAVGEYTYAVIEENSDCVDAIDFSDIEVVDAAVNTDRLSIGIFPRISAASNGVMSNPQTGDAFTKITEILDYMITSGQKVFSFYSGRTNIKDLDDTAFSSYKLIRLTMLSGIDILCEMLNVGKDDYKTCMSQFFYHYASGAWSKTAPESLLAGNIVLDANAFTNSDPFAAVYFPEYGRNSLIYALRLSATSTNTTVGVGGNTKDNSPKNVRVGTRSSDGNNYGYVDVRYASVYPSPTNSVSLGTDSMYWSEIHAGNGTIQSSDERLKTNIEAPQETLMRAWSKVNFKVFKFIDAVQKKGELARFHVGAIAQEVRDAFASEGLDASRYGLYCYRSWEDIYEEVVVENPNAEEGQPKTTTERILVQPAGDKYSLRYTECLVLECAYQRWLGKQRDAKIEALMQRISALENNH